jgi:hypothetical protein
MLRYRNSFDDKGQREDLQRVYEDEGSPLSSLLQEKLTLASQQTTVGILEHLEPLTSTRRGKQKGGRAYEAVFEYAKFSERPQSAPMRRSKSSPKVPAAPVRS